MRKTTGIVLDNRKLSIDGKEYRLFGAEVEYWRLEPAYWETILRRLLDAGMNIVGTYVPWRAHEIERGKYDLTGRTDKRLDLPGFLGLCGKLGLKACLRPGPAVLSEFECGGFPNWLVADPDMCVWDLENKLPDGFGMPGQKKGANPSYLHPTYLRYAEEWLSAVDDAIRDYFHSQGGPIVFVQLDNEVSMICKDSMFGSDYNPYLVGRGGLYHQWLAQKYKAIGNLPYQKRYACFEDIPAPRELDRRKPDLSYYFDWIGFKEWMMAEYLRRLRAIHEKNHIGKVIYYTNLNAHRPETVPNNWKLYEDAVGGICGSDFYRKPWMTPDDYYRMALVIKLSDAITTFPWSPEFQAGIWGSSRDTLIKEDSSWHQVIPAEHTEFMSLAALAHGLKGLYYYMFADREWWFNAPVSEFGQIRYSYEALKKVMRFVNGVKDFSQLKRVSDVAVLFYRPYAWLCHLEDPMPGNENNVHLGEIRLAGVQSGRTYLEFEGLLRLISQAGYDPGIVDPWVYPERIHDYRAVFVPAQSLMDERTQQLLLDYADKGGRLIIGPVIPHEDLNGTMTDILRAHINMGERLYADNVHLDTEIGNIVAQELVVYGDGEGLLRGRHANFLTQKTIGKGRLIHLGAFIGQSAAGEEPAGNVALVRHLLRNVVGIKPRIEVNDRSVDAVVQTDGREEYLFLINIDNRPRPVCLTIDTEDVTAIVELETGVEHGVEDKQAHLVVDSKKVGVFLLKREYGAHSG